MTYRNRMAIGLITVMAVTIACSLGGLGGTEQIPPPNDTNMLAPTQSGGSGGSTTSGGTAGGGPVVPCTILTAADAETFIGGPVTVSQDISEKQTATCAYTSADGAASSIVAVFQTSDDAENIPAAYDVMKQFAGDQFQDIAGLGDAAFYHIQYEQLIFRKGSYLVTLSGYPGTGIDLVTALTTAAQAVAGRLP